MNPNCTGAGRNIGPQYGGCFKCPHCKAEWATCEVDDIIVPEHVPQEFKAHSVEAYATARWAAYENSIGILPEEKA